MNQEFFIRDSELDLMDLDANILTHLLCYKCELHFEEFSESQTENVHLWSRDVATRAMQAGWRYVDRQIICYDCFTKSTVA